MQDILLSRIRNIIVTQKDLHYGTSEDFESELSKIGVNIGLNSHDKTEVKLWIEKALLDEELISHTKGFSRQKLIDILVKYTRSFRIVWLLK